MRVLMRLRQAVTLGEVKRRPAGTATSAPPPANSVTLGGVERVRGDDDLDVPIDELPDGRFTPPAGFPS
jgi:hypothetical protein